MVVCHFFSAEPCGCAYLPTSSFSLHCMGELLFLSTDRTVWKFHLYLANLFTHSFFYSFISLCIHSFIASCLHSFYCIIHALFLLLRLLVSLTPRQSWEILMKY